MYRNTILLEAEYGLGASCAAEVPVSEVQGVSASDLLVDLIRRPQRTNEAGRTALVLQDMLTAGRAFDLAVSTPRNGERAAPRHVLPTDVVVRPADAERGLLPHKVTLHVSESYRGGGSFSGSGGDKC
jgi:hypothetical protein